MACVDLVSLFHQGNPNTGVSTGHSTRSGVYKHVNYDEQLNHDIDNGLGRYVRIRQTNDGDAELPKQQYIKSSFAKISRAVCITAYESTVDQTTHAYEDAMKIFLYGSRNDVMTLLSASDSTSSSFLLEYPMREQVYAIAGARIYGVVENGFNTLTEKITLGIIVNRADPESDSVKKSFNALQPVAYVHDLKNKMAPYDSKAKYNMNRVMDIAKTPDQSDMKFALTIGRCNNANSNTPRVCGADDYQPHLYAVGPLTTLVANMFGGETDHPTKFNSVDATGPPTEFNSIDPTDKHEFTLTVMPPSEDVRSANNCKNVHMTLCIDMHLLARQVVYNLWRETKRKSM